MRIISRISAAFALFALLLGVAALVLIWQVNHLLARYHIEQLDYRVASLSWQAVQFEQLTVTQQTDAARQQVWLKDARLTWQWAGFFQPVLEAVTAAEVEWTYTPAESTETADTGITLPEQWQLPAIAPEHLTIDHLVITLPCHAGTCSYSGPLDIHRTDEGFKGTLSLSPASQFVANEALHLEIDYQVVRLLPQLDATLHVEPESHLRLYTTLSSANELFWQARVESKLHSPPAWFRDALAQWNIHLDDQWAAAIQQPVVLDAEWNLAVLPLLNFDSTGWNQALRGSVRLDAHVPAPIELLGYGKVSGHVSLAFEADQHRIKHYALSTDVLLSEMTLPEMPGAVGISLDSLHFKVASVQQSSVNLQQLPLKLDLVTEGDIAATLTGDLLLKLDEQMLSFEDVAVIAAAQQFQPLAPWVLKDVRIALGVHGHLQRNHVDLQFDELEASAAVASPTIKARSVTLRANNTKLSGGFDEENIDWNSVAGSAEPSLSVQQFQYPQLRSSSWTWRGKLDGSLKSYKLAGDLKINDALTIRHTLEGSTEQLKGRWQLDDIFLLAGNPVAALVEFWPHLLTLERGKVKADGHFSYRFDGSPMSHTTLYVNDLGGIYDTTLFRGLNTRLELETHQQVLRVVAEELRLDQLNKGFVMGPFLAAGEYESALNNLTEGKLLLQNFSADVMGGTVTTPPKTFNFVEDKQSLVLTLDNIDLGLLLQQHPSSELSGSGRISGTVPIEITAKGVSVPNGVVAARPPGGQLQLHSERAEALAKSQPSMKLITDALEDFHYTVLASEVSYDEDGKLLLALRLEGRNPALENGRPVHFNINLEEDLPAMIASIQLSNQISDIVKKRLQEHLQKRSAR